MTPTKVVFVDRGTIPPDIHFPPLSFDHKWAAYDFTQPDELLQRVRDANIVMTNKVIFNADILSQLPQLRLIAVAATGVDNIDIDYCGTHGIAVTNVRGYATRSVPEHVIGMIFALRRNFMGYHRDIAKGEWQRHRQFCFFTHKIGDVAGSTLGVIGAGVLGKATAALAESVGMTVMFAERKGRSECRKTFFPFEQVLRQADVITLHCPLSEGTHRLIGRDELALMKSHAILINTGRGGLVDEDALAAALKNGTIAGAGVDVFTREPADQTNPLLANMDLPNLLLTPHVAWGSHSSIQQLANILIDNINAFEAGEMRSRTV